MKEDRRDMQELDARIKSESAKWKKVIEASGAKPE